MKFHETPISCERPFTLVAHPTSSAGRSRFQIQKPWIICEMLWMRCEKTYYVFCELCFVENITQFFSHVWYHGAAASPLTGNRSRGATLGGHRVNHFGDPQITDIYVYIFIYWSNDLIISMCVLYIFICEYIIIYTLICSLILFVYTVAFK